MNTSICFLDFVGKMYIDIAVNLTDDMFEGIYHEKKRHDSDRDVVIERAKTAGCTQMILLAGSFEDSKKCFALCEELDPKGSSLFTTVGVHPTRCEGVAFSEKDFERLINNRTVALGEMGLDYDRLFFCEKETQLIGFEGQLELVGKFDLPLILHLRNAFEDFVSVMEKHRHAWEKRGGVVHSFTGSRDEMETLVEMGLYIGINGCSLRDPNFLESVLPNIPLDRILVETDAPYCDIRPTHPSWKHITPITTCKPEKWVPNTIVKNRNESACINLITQVIAGVRKEHYPTMCETIRQNTLRLFHKLVRIA